MYFLIYELDNLAGELTESRSFYSGESTHLVIASGYDDQTVSVYELMEVNGDQVTIIIRLFPDANQSEQLESLSHRENWHDEIVNYLMEHGAAANDIFFLYNESIDEVQITMDGEDYSVYPMEAGEYINYFKEDEGLWMKEYEDGQRLVIRGDG